MTDFKLSEHRILTHKGSSSDFCYFEEDVKKFIEKLKEEISRNSHELDNRIRRQYVKSPLKKRFLKELEELDNWNKRAFKENIGDEILE